MTRATLALALLLSAGCAGRGDPLAETGPATSHEPTTFVVVHGAWGGGWAWGAVDSMLTSAGHRVSRPTLTGLGERVHLARPETDLETHVTDVVNHLVFERLDDVVLVGHSYGGMVAVGVAHRVPERIRRLVLLDAFLPEDGESVVDAVRAAGGESGIGNMVGGAGTGPIVPAWVDPDAPWPTDVPQPLRTFTQPLELRDPAASRLPGTYILTVDPGAQPEDDFFAAFARRAEARGWQVLVLRADHNPQNSARAELTALLREIAP
ncbi:MAG: alpha/beta hydrolase [Gemmatimonadetes bacterium]|nr:alpha/beta hydrolase [Gemmatimonadota bacterium]